MMTTEDENESNAPITAEATADEGLVRSPSDLVHEGEGDDGDEGDASPAQLGYKRFVYAAYLAGAILVAFIGEKAITAGWTRLAQWRPNVGEPQEGIVLTVSTLLGAGVALYYWKRTRTRELAEDVAAELAKVTWPSRKEVTNNTVIVILTTAFATVFFTLMDRFWSFVTNLVYGT